MIKSALVMASSKSAVALSLTKPSPLKPEYSIPPLSSIGLRCWGLYAEQRLTSNPASVKSTADAQPPLPAPSIAIFVKTNTDTFLHLFYGSYYGNAAISFVISGVSGTWVSVRFTCKGFDRGTVFAKSVNCTTVITFCIVLLAIVVA